MIKDYWTAIFWREFVQFSVYFHIFFDRLYLMGQGFPV